MAKPRKQYSCSSCGSVTSQWAGQCVDCKDWNTLVEDVVAAPTPFAAKHSLRQAAARFS